MEQPQYLIDTNAVIDYLGNKFPVSGMDFMNGIIDAVPQVSVISKIELLGFNTLDKHYNTISNFIKDSTVLDLTNNVVEATIEIRKNHKTKLPDAIIAVTALVYDMELISRNIPDFKNIVGLKVIDPHSL
ncbi:MAG: type II toxin-antitoxin system VapC family toxin [Saprospiraceae bacterium]|nr:type II toxin-antitoxin system VapC family toxin [Saprospiraceae bacterium]